MTSSTGKAAEWLGEPIQRILMQASAAFAPKGATNDEIRATAAQYARSTNWEELEREGFALQAERVECLLCSTMFDSRAATWGYIAHDEARSTTVSKDPCPKCGGHAARSGHTTVGRIWPRADEGVTVCPPVFSLFCDPDVATAERYSTKPPPVRAGELLTEARQTVESRVPDYDRGDDRSMARAVRIFNAKTDRDLTEYEAWLFMASLKDARAITNPRKRDTYVDQAGYAGLAGECALNAVASAVLLPELGK